MWSELKWAAETSQTTTYLKDNKIQQRRQWPVNEGNFLSILCMKYEIMLVTYTDLQNKCNVKNWTDDVNSNYLTVINLFQSIKSDVVLPVVCVQLCHLAVTKPFLLASGCQTLLCAANKHDSTMSCAAQTLAELCNYSYNSSSNYTVSGKKRGQ